MSLQHGETAVKASRDRQFAMVDWRMAWFTSILAITLAALTVTTPGRAADKPQKAFPKQPVKEIHQGGYVERVEPGVDYKNRLPRVAPKTPAASLKAFDIIKGFQVKLAASEPQVCDPVDITFDEDGRMIVAELITYSEARDTHAGRVSVLEDTNQDGLYDKRTILVDQLDWPSGVLWFDGGVFVANSTDLLYCKDTDGDGKADVRRIVLTGFSISNPNQCANSLRWTFDSRVELMPSNGGGLIESVQWNADHPDHPIKPVQIRGRDMSFDPRTGRMRPESGGSQYGMTFSDWGCKFESSNSTPIEMIMYEDRYILRNPFLAAPSARIRIWVDGMSVYRTSPVEPWRIIRTEMRKRGVFSGPVEGGGRPDGYFTSACGIMIYKGDAWPDAFRGNAFVCEGASDLVHRMRLDPSGIAFTAHRTEKKHEFLTSDEIWSKPVQLHNGPDGLLYVVDMYREVYEHPDAIPPSVRKYIDLNTGNDRGRIYRIIPDGFQQPNSVHLGRLTTHQLVALLAHPNFWHWSTASRLLNERQDPAAIVPLHTLAAESRSPLGRMHALYVLAGMNRLTAEDILPRLSDTHPRVREHAIRLSEKVLVDSPAVRAQLYKMTDQQDARCRYQLAFSLGNVSGDQATAALAKLARQDGAERWNRLAILSSCFGRAGDLFSQAAADTKWRSLASSIALLELLAEQAGRQNMKDQVGEVIRSLESFDKKETKLSKAVARGLTKGLSGSHSPLLALLTGNSSTRAGELLATLIRDAKKTAADEKKTPAERVEAIRSLSMAPFEQVHDVLELLLDSREAAVVQKAALQTLSRFQEPAVAQMIIDGWAGFTPAVRNAAAEAIFSRPQRLVALLKAVKEQTITTSQLDPARIQFLLKHSNSKIREEAERLLAGVKLTRREDAMAAYKDVLKMKGDTQKGKVIFKRECSQCHKLQGVGYDLGLPLQNVKTRGAEGILMQVLDPNREVNPAYVNYSVLTEDGRLLTGVITAETATSITLSRAEGEKDTVLRNDIDEIRSTDLSIMPEGLETKVNQQEMADVIAYLLHVVE